MLFTSDLILSLLTDAQPVAAVRRFGKKPREPFASGLPEKGPMNGANLHLDQISSPSSQAS